MTAAEQQISGNPAAMENAQARTTVTDQAKVQDIISRMDRAHETPMFHRIVTLVAAGMLMDSIDVYIGSAVASSTLATRWSTVAQNSTFMSAGFLVLLVGSLLAEFVGDLKGRRVAYQINLLLFGGFTFLGAFAPNMAVLSLCRLGAGLALGAEIVTGFAMVNEFAPMNRRGHWCAIVSLVANCGVPIAMLLCASYFPLVLASAVRGHRPGGRHHLVAAPRHPQSPRWLAVRGRYDEARRHRQAACGQRFRTDRRSRQGRHQRHPQRRRPFARHLPACGCGCCGRHERVLLRLHFLGSDDSGQAWY